MWIYQKKLEFPINISNPDLRIAKALMAQYGGPDSELGAGMRYLTQRFTMPDDRVKATLNDIGTEEISHWEMIGTMIHQTMERASLADIEAAGLAGYYTLHGKAVYPADPNGVPFTASYIQATGDPLADIMEDLAAEGATGYAQHFLMSSFCHSLNFLNVYLEFPMNHYRNLMRSRYPASNVDIIDQSISHLPC